MPARRFTDEEEEAIASSYRDGENATQIAGRLGVGKSLVCKVLKRRGVDVAAYSPYTANRIECPYSNDRLHEMYWREGISISEIGADAKKHLGMRKPIAQRVVERWMREAGITPRTLAEAQRNRVNMHPEQFGPEKVDRMQRGWFGAVDRGEYDPLNNPPVPKRVWRKGIRAAAKLKREARTTRKCVICGVEKTQAPSKWRTTIERTTCSYTCAGKLRANSYTFMRQLHDHCAAMLVDDRRD